MMKYILMMICAIGFAQLSSAQVAAQSTPTDSVKTLTVASQDNMSAIPVGIPTNYDQPMLVPCSMTTDTGVTIYFENGDVKKNESDPKKSEK